MTTLATKVHLTGIADTEVGRVPGATVLSLMEDAARAAVADAGLSLDRIDGVLTGRSMVEPLHRVAAMLAERLGLEPAVFATLEAGGATSIQLLIHASLAVAAGAAHHVVCVAGDPLLSGLTRDRAVTAMAENAHPDFEVPFGTSPPSAYALVARAHMDAFGTTREQLAEIAVATRAWATRNPAAQQRAPLTVDEVLGAKPVAEPFGLLDCALVSDGAAAFVVSSAETETGRGVRVLGFGEGTTHEYLTRSPSLTAFASARTGPRALEMAGVRPDEIDVVELYDCFTITPVVMAEDLGFCPKGEGGPFLAGRTGPGGPFPMNTHGGLLSHAHPGKPGGIFHLTEAVRQLRGEAEDRQVPGAEVALVHGVGGMMSAHATAVLGGPAT